MKRLFAAMLVGTAMLATPAAAKDEQGNIQVKLLGTVVMPDGAISAVNVDTVGLPGDTVQLRQSILYINGKPVEREKVDDFIDRSGPNNYTRTARYMETLPNGRKHYILEVTVNTIFDNTPVYTVPEGHYFAMGDNRDRSRDSRFLDDVGYIPRQNLVGRAEFLFFSVDGVIWEFWKWAKTLRFERFFEAIE